MGKLIFPRKSGHNEELPACPYCRQAGGTVGMKRFDKAFNDFKALLAKREFIGSMSKKGDCWNNAVAESFFHTLKVELIH